MIKAAQQDDQQRLISQIDIITKSFKKFTLDVSPGPLGTILTRVNGRSKAASLRELPAFKTNERVSVEEWDEFTLATEYAMMKVPNNEWKITDLNKNFELCSTYPKVLAVPTTATDFIIKGSAKFRSRQRLPILTYLHGNGGSIVRCAQPMAGANNRSEMVKYIHKTLRIIFTGRKTTRALRRYKQKPFEWSHSRHSPDDKCDGE